jgi:hypothetical protein
MCQPPQPQVPPLQQHHCGYQLAILGLDQVHCHLATQMLPLPLLCSFLWLLAAAAAPL